MALTVAVGTDLRPGLVDTAIAFLGACTPPNDHALYTFIEHNVESFDERQRQDVLRLVTWPVRERPEFYTQVMAAVATRHFPDAREIWQMWTRWIEIGAIDGHVADLAREIARAEEQGPPGWEVLHEALRRHVRSCLRSKDRERVSTAIEHIMAASINRTRVLGLLLAEANGVTGTFEWESWRRADPATASFMKWWLHHVTEEAVGDKNWRRGVEERPGHGRLRAGAPGGDAGGTVAVGGFVTLHRRSPGPTTPIRLLPTRVLGAEEGVDTEAVGV